MRSVQPSSKNLRKWSNDQLRQLDAVMTGCAAWGIRRLRVCSATREARQTPRGGVPTTSVPSSGCENQKLRAIQQRRARPWCRASSFERKGEFCVQWTSSRIATDGPLQGTKGETPPWAGRRLESDGLDYSWFDFRARSRSVSAMSWQKMKPSSSTVPVKRAKAIHQRSVIRNASS